MKAQYLTPSLFLAISMALLAIACQNDTKAHVPYVAPSSSITQNPPPLPTEDRHPSKKIKLALILDTSNSMDGLIDQAKSQLWSMVNKLADAKCDNLRPSIEIALYEYGNDNLNAREGFIRMVTPLTEDLDKLSEDLFSLSTKGGSEHCGQVIATSLDQLKWSESSEDLQVIFIAGNEPFTQGPISYQNACKRAKQNKVVVNTIFCGNFQEGINSSWKSGALMTGGEYMSINQNSKTVYIPSPYDDKISALNDRLNDTYIQYGVSGNQMKSNQLRQDANASSYSLQNKVSRTISKSKHIYKNESWDLVDASENRSFNIADIEEEELNDEMKDMNLTERKKYVEEKAEERKNIQSEINQLAVKRSEYVANQQNKKSEGMLNNALLSAIVKQAEAKKFEF